MTQTQQAAPGARAGNSLAEIAAALRDGEDFLIATHENPDGDAIGSARGMELILAAIGKQALVYVPHACVPEEYEFIRPGSVLDTAPDDLAQRTLVCVDCGNESRIA